MAAPQPTFRTEVPPPELPFIKSLDDQLAQYLRTFALWCRNGFRDKLSQTVANHGIMLQAVDKNTGQQTAYTYLVGVQVTVSGGTPTNPTITFTLVPTGIGSP